MPTIKEIATMASVSRSTVSRVLNDSGYVSDEARKRVEQVIKETGYMPSVQAKALRTKKTKVIGVIVPTIRTETSSRLVAGMDYILAEAGYQVLLATTNQEREKELEFLQLLQTRQVDGIIFAATNVEPTLIEKINCLSIPITVIGQEIDGVPNVLYDDYHAAKDLTQLLISKGHKRIGFIGVNEKDRAVGYLRKKAFLEMMKRASLNVETGWVQEGIFDIHSGYVATEKMLAYSKQLPTAIFAVTDRLAIGAMQFLKQHNYRVPDDIAVVGIGASEISEHLTPALTTVDYQYEQAGRQAAMLLIQQLNVKESVTKKIVLDYRLLDRDSV
ncbi:catabolite control protein A [Paraliobacillus ryukyuensis]|uniref:LacI family transcriptional regulator n=1 Tax=Paraliobacillus ryukyuensis TaxID=200904 RepID=A0A366EDC7_9BACI|nr:LacI family DNA-binding transcriptional regulator [Paraliobacillus ryukyuensis]RBP00382.1 LacI family transcriptional regulator [Paraliobacillus ryukyuensis]